MQNHGPPEEDFKKGIWLISFYFLIEIVTGFLTNSRSMVGDGFHMFTDLCVLILTFWGLVKDKLEPHRIFRYLGFNKENLETRIAIINTALLLGVIVWIIREGFNELFLSKNSKEIMGLPLFIVAVIGLFINIRVFKLLHLHRHSGKEIKTAALHVLSDTLSSVAVIISALAALAGIYWVDTVSSFIIAGLLFFGIYKIWTDNPV